MEPKFTIPYTTQSISGIFRRWDTRRCTKRVPAIEPSLYWIYFIFSEQRASPGISPVALIGAIERKIGDMWRVQACKTLHLMRKATVLISCLHQLAPNPVKLLMMLFQKIAMPLSHLKCNDNINSEQNKTSRAIISNGQNIGYIPASSTIRKWDSLSFSSALCKTTDRKDDLVVEQKEGWMYLNLLSLQVF